MARFLNVVRRGLIIITILTQSSQAFGDETTDSVGNILKEEQSQSALYQYGWLGIYGVSSLSRGIRAKDAPIYAYQEAHSLLALRSFFGVLKFVFEPLKSHGAYQQYTAIMADASLDEQQKRAKVIELNRQVALDQQKKRSLRGLIVGTGIHTLVAARILQKTEDEYFAGRAFLGGMAAQLLSMYTVPEESLTWYRGQNKLEASLIPNFGDGGASLVLSYSFH